MEGGNAHQERRCCKELVCLITNKTTTTKGAAALPILCVSLSHEKYTSHFCHFVRFWFVRNDSGTCTQAHIPCIQST